MTTSSCTNLVMNFGWCVAFFVLNTKNSAPLCTSVFAVAAADATCSACCCDAELMHSFSSPRVVLSYRASGATHSELFCNIFFRKRCVRSQYQYRCLRRRLRLRDVPCPNLGPQTGCHDRGLSFSSTPSGTSQDILHLVTVHPSMSFPIHCLPRNHPVVYTL
jgi:hypothetical protein